MYTQRRFDNKSVHQITPWQIHWELPEALQFCSYVGQIHDFRPDATIGKIQPIKREWIDWCKQLFSAFAAKSPYSAAMTSTTGVADTLNFEPPYFTELADRPHLQTVCRENWPYFNQLWNGKGGGQRQLNERLSQMQSTLDLDDLVQNCIHNTGKSGSAAFSLQIGIVRWPEDHRQIVSKNCLVIGAGYLEREQRPSLISLLQSQLCDLISGK